MVAVAEPALTVSVKEEVVALAPLLSVAVMAREESPREVGIPEITPVKELRDSPEGRAPEVRAKVVPPDPPEVERERE